MKYIVAVSYQEAIWHAYHDLGLPKRELYGPKETRWMYISTNSGTQAYDRLMGLEINIAEVHFVGQWNAGRFAHRVVELLRTRYRTPEASASDVRELRVEGWWVRWCRWARGCFHRNRRGGTRSC